MRTARAWFADGDPRLRRFVLTMVSAGVLATLLYLPILWGFELYPLRSALGRPAFADFYDIQARAFLDGDLALPEGSLGIEAFTRDGREYTYFAPGPAIARLPIQALTGSFDGRLSAPSMLVAWCVTLVFLSLLLWRVRTVLRGRAPLGRGEALAHGCLLVASSAGSVLLYLGALPWVYHEAYAWSVASATAMAFFVLGVLERPTRNRALACAGACLAGVLSRAPTGWAAIVAMVVTAIGLLAVRPAVHRRVGWFLLAGASLAASLSIGVNWAKFEHPFEFPLEQQEWTRVNEHRREALAANGGDLVSFDLLPSTIVSYFRPDGIRFVPVPPFITFPTEPARAVGGGFLDQSYRTGSAVPFMLPLVVLAVWGLVTTFRPRGPDRAHLLRIPVVTTGLITGPILIYGYISYRYLSDLLPILVLASMIGLVDLVHLVSLQGPRLQRVAVGALVAGTGFAVAANAGTAVTTQRLANPGSGLVDHIAFQHRVSELLPGHPLRAMTSHSDALPSSAPGEHLHIVGDCDALYVSQAETTWAWVPVEARTFTVQVDRRDRPAGVDRIELARTVDGSGALTYERRADGAYRLAFRGSVSRSVGAWVDRSDPVIEVEVRADPQNDSWYAIGNGGNLLVLPLSEYDDAWIRRQNPLVPVDPGPGVAVTKGEPPRLCAELLNALEQ